MSGVQSVTLITPNPVAPPDHDAKMIALVDSKSQPPAPALPPVDAPADRPSWLPEKFKTAEEMATSYAALEAKLSGAKAPEATPPAKTADPLAIPPADVVADAVASAGLDMAAMSAEFAAEGDLSEATRAALAAKGFDKATVDGYIAGQQALATQFQNDVMSATPGGADKYSEMVEWAKVNLSEADIAAYNTAVNTSDRAVAKLAVAGLGVRFAAAVGSEPVLSGGRVAASAGDSFASLQEMKVAMGSYEYKTDPAFRAKVAEKLARSSIM